MLIYMSLPPTCPLNLVKNHETLIKQTNFLLATRIGHPVTEIIRFTLQMQPLLLADRNIDYSRIVGL